MHAQKLIYTSNLPLGRDVSAQSIKICIRSALCFGKSPNAVV